MSYYGRTDGGSDKSNWQTVYNHLYNVAKLTAAFADKFKSHDIGYMIGLLHDLGKYSDEFQKRLEDNKIKVDHSTAGAREAYKTYKGLGLLAAYAIAGHHSGLPDFGSIANASSLESRLKLSIIPDYSHYKEEINEFPFLGEVKLPIKKADGFSISFYIRMLFSCLVDADSIDAEKSSGNPNAKYRGIYYDMKILDRKLFDFLKVKIENAPKNKINTYRKEILESCIRKADNKAGIYSLTVPTGGGKTLSSLAFALRHALKNNMERVIYVIPYTSIIEQNAKVFRDILGGEFVLEHHSNYQYPDDSDDWSEDELKQYLACENWDIPIIVTTNVQFFESIFSSKRSKCRKLHNITKSVIILDEAQMLPTEHLKPCLAALSEITENYGSSVVLCTATQPVIGKYIPGHVKPIELMEDPKRLYLGFKRVDSRFIGEVCDNELIEKLKNEHQVLCIVNTRKHAQMLYEDLKGVAGLYHLSARMCPAHRRAKLDEIRKALEDNKPCIVISTQLIEAGVDVDFPSVYRSIAGIDSIVQSAGRCNREGKLQKGIVNIFIPEKHGMPPGWISRTAEVAKMILQDFKDPLSLEAIEKYFNTLYTVEESRLDKENILADMRENEKRLEFPFAEVSNKFKIIDGQMVSLIIPWNEKCMEVLETVRYSEYPGSYGRRLQPYVVQIYQYEFNMLKKSGAIEDIAGIYNILSNRELYSEDTGLTQSKEVDLIDQVLIF